MEAAGAQQELLWTRSHPVICQINRPGSWSGCRALTGSGRYVRWQLSPTVTRGRASCQTRLVCLSSSWPPAVCRLLGFQQFWGFELRISILAFDSRYCEGKSSTTAQNGSIFERCEPTLDGLRISIGYHCRLSCQCYSAKEDREAPRSYWPGIIAKLQSFHNCCVVCTKCLTVVAQRGTTDHHTAVCGPHANASPSWR